MRIRITCLLLALVVAAIAVPAQQPPTCDTAKHRQFDFWVGDWTVTGPNGAVAGENRVESILGGCVLQENWTGTSGSSGKSFNMYYAGDDTWRQTWVDNSGTRLDLAGSLDKKGRMVFKGTTPGREGGTVQHDLSFTPKKDGSVIQHWKASRDGGKTWQDLFVGTYRKKG